MAFLIAVTLLAIVATGVVALRDHALPSPRPLGMLAPLDRFLDNLAMMLGRWLKLTRARRSRADPHCSAGCRGSDGLCELSAELATALRVLHRDWTSRQCRRSPDWRFGSTRPSRWAGPAVRSDVDPTRCAYSVLEV